MSGVLNDCVELARRAGEAILMIYAQAFSVTEKDDRSPLTEADMAAHRCIVEGLRRIAPDWPVLSEEGAGIEWSVRRQWQRYWLVDPLDGTREFIKRNGEFTVNIALIDHGRPLLGVVHAPALDHAWWAEVGQGAWQCASCGVPQRLHCRQPAGQPLRVIASRSHLDARTAALLARIGDCERIGLGSSLKFCRIAEGEADVYPRFGPTSEWDTAAGQCVLEQAGGVVLDRDGRPFVYNAKASLLNGDFLALGDPDLPWQAWLHD